MCIPYTATGEAFKARFSPDQQYIAIGLKNFTVMILDANYNFVTALSTPIEHVHYLDFSSGSDKLIIGGHKNTGY